MKTSKESFAYTPGLKVTPCTYIRRLRSLPLKGEVLVKKGEKVNFDTTVATCCIEGAPYIVKVAELLDVDPEETVRYILKKEGDIVRKGELLARHSSLFGLINKKVFAEVSGVIERINEITGHLTIREPPKSVEVKAYIKGKVDEVIPNEAAVIGTYAAFIQGIIGFSGERFGEIRVAVSNPEQVLEADMITENDAGKIIVGGSLVTYEALEKARKAKVNGIVVGGARMEDLESILRTRIGVAITGRENIEFTLILTEGFGKLPMSENTFSVLKENEGKIAAINGTTQVRAGVLRPEIIIPLEVTERSRKEKELEEGKMKVGSIVRIIRFPYFGAVGKVIELPIELNKIETESFVRVVRVELSDGRWVLVPRANVEIIAD
ncbi:MAG: hypothetical protein ACPLW8_03795 [Candidatus Bathyarchaeales archaeon]